MPAAIRPGSGAGTRFGPQTLEGHLGVAVFIAHEDHGNAVRQQQRGRQVAHLALPQAKHILLGCLALRATVPAQVVVLPVPAKGSGIAIQPFPSA